MGDLSLYRARSLVHIPRSPSQATSLRSRSADNFRIRRVISTPTLSVNPDIFYNSRYRPRHYNYTYKRDWDLYDDYLYDRNFYMTAYNSYPTYRSLGRRYSFLDAPYGYDWSYPYRFYPSRYTSVGSSYLDPLYWRRYYDPYYERPLSYPYRPWLYDTYDVNRAVDLYKKGIINWSSLDKYWLNPYSSDRRLSRLRDVYIPTGYYGARRYYYSFGFYY